MNTKFRLFEQKMFRLLSAGEQLAWQNLKQKGILRDKVVTYIQSHMANLTVQNIPNDPNMPNELRGFVYDMTQLRKIIRMINRVEDFWKMQTVDNSSDHKITTLSLEEARKVMVKRLEAYLGYELVTNKYSHNYKVITDLCPFRLSDKYEVDNYDQFRKFLSCMNITRKVFENGYYALKSPIFSLVKVMLNADGDIRVYFKEDDREEILKRIRLIYFEYLRSSEAGGQDKYDIG